MCQSIRVENVGGLHATVFIENIGEAKAKFGAEALVFIDDDKRDIQQDNECLCWLDHEATAARAGYTATNQHGGDPFEWHFSKQTAQGGNTP